MLLPRQIRVRYLEILLEWTVAALAKSAAGSGRDARRDRGLKAAGEKHAAGLGNLPAGTAGMDLHADPRAWRLLHALLQARASAPGVMLSESLVPAMAATISGLQEHPASGGTDSFCAYAMAVGMWPCSALQGLRAASVGSQAQIAENLGQSCRRQGAIAPLGTKCSHQLQGASCCTWQGQ